MLQYGVHKRAVFRRRKSRLFLHEIGPFEYILGTAMHFFQRRIGLLLRRIFDGEATLEFRDGELRRHVIDAVRRVLPSEHLLDVVLFLARFQRLSPAQFLE